MTTRNLNILNEFNILYLEDDDSLLKQTRDMLEDFVKNVFAVKTSEAALQVLKKEKIDIIISDILLENENGIDFLRDLKVNKNINIPTVLTTAHTDTKYLLDAIKLKIENYIVKPINLKELLNTLHDIVLPLIQEKEIHKNSNIIKTISAITDSKQVEVVKCILDHLNERNELVASYSDIMQKVSISKPTLIKLFKELSEKKILVKIAHKTYRFDEKALELV
ncbi:two-component response regulator [Sulfurimonas gotlandica GD1]|jgi:response regulator RpfG family c-di-GMP phosphodiesterase|uniref:Two-component response regulator n=1 Tax=Sulfurimonas gotlandica (strain DSM 19862 / JCM 16533 / GD1) TaxID=929558 RepID=B6BLI3_SULGG|nr:response regulator [Sulfurimonas gotlandica]EDZ62100.1 response regulator receiver domain protein [Sulfurimonas gotlandica GD1]EHP28640.1 two-component response regulator [Sulfurimonas gotlandica GD1]